MASAQVALPRDVHTTVKYLLPGSKNERYFSKGIEVNIGDYEDTPIIVRDARPQREEYTLDTAGFALVGHKSQVTDFYDRNQLDNEYTNEMASFLKAMTGADEVIVLSAPVLRKNKEDPGSTYQPRAMDVHTDYSPANAEWAAGNRVDNVGSYSRFICINIWRPLTPPPQDWPLGLVDARTVGSDEGIAYPMIIVPSIPDKLPIVPLPPYQIEGANFVHKPEHEWRYFSDMTKDEVLVFKLYDSDRKNGSKSWRCPHTAFYDERKGTIPRESVEVRTICYFK